MSRETALRNIARHDRHGPQRPSLILRTRSFLSTSRITIRTGSRNAIAGAMPFSVYVIEGMDVVDKIAGKVRTGPQGALCAQDVPVVPVVIKKGGIEFE